MIEVGNATILQGNCTETMKQLAAESVQCCITSPPYFGLRDYGADGQIGLEPTPDEYVAKLVEVFREVHRVLADDGTLWLNIGDSYANVGKWGGSTSGKHVKSLHGVQQSSGRVRDTSTGLAQAGYKPKDLIGIPWMVAFALRADGWYLRSDIIWSKPNPMPESVTDRPSKAHEYLFLMTKSEKYFYDSAAIREKETCGRMRGPALHPDQKSTNGNSGLCRREGDGMRNKRSVWEVATAPYAGAHFATFPPKLIEPCILAGAREGDTILDPFNGSGTTGIVALKHGRKYIGCELNPEYVALTLPRLEAEQAQMKLAL